MNYIENLPLFQQENHGWLDPQPNPDIVRFNQQMEIPAVESQMTTHDILKITQLPRHRLPRIGAGVSYQSYFLLHEKKDCWKAYRQISA
ncbi:MULTISPECIES: hypothetical protein [Cyanophyceae]|uniref:hypothetical protein n=1 Tax=Cyanophyceae TaxID=3028117 RepID=UPI00059C5CD8|nr:MULTISPECIES: hypothetical protein [Cyanophyceae]SMH58953.1 hypothetical protein SAMN06272755_3285 [Picosynechococcus sp. OG1]SMQ86521.1 hypothetical protein SAMN06272774_3279 [Synechococcus sp. 7002]